MTTRALIDVTIEVTQEDLNESGHSFLVWRRLAEAPQRAILRCLKPDYRCEITPLGEIVIRQVVNAWEMKIVHQIEAPAALAVWYRELAEFMGNNREPVEPFTFTLSLPAECVKAEGVEKI